MCVEIRISIKWKKIDFNGISLSYLKNEKQLVIIYGL